MKTLETREWIGVSVAIVVVIVLFFGQSIWTAIVGPQTADKQAAPLTKDTEAPTQPTVKDISTIAGIQIYDMNVGTGTEAVSGKTIAAHYIGTLEDGTKFDSSLDRGQPFEFKLGAGQVIKGWDVGIAGMKVGGIRTLVISPELGYGAQAIGSIPANSTLIFQVQLMGVK